MQIEAAKEKRQQGSPPGRQQFSVLVLTRDEELNIAACLECCVALSDDVVVLDSFSTDRTLEIVRQFPGVRIVQRAFDTWAKHSNWALENIAYKHPWVYYSDADERFSQDLGEEVLRVINDTSLTHAAYRLRYKNIFRNTWIRHGGIYPIWIMRLYRPDRVRYEDREVNAHPVVNGSIGELKSHFIHYSFNKGLVPWFHKHNSYSQMEAREGLRVLQGSAARWLRSLLQPDRATRRRALKNLSFFMPGRATLRFLYLYFARAGFLDGSAGFHYAVMISMYEYWIDLKIREQTADWRGQTDRIIAMRMGEAPGHGGSEGLAPVPGQQATAAHAKPPSEPPLVEVMIPTLNEADHIREVVANALTLGPVFVLDSGSTDNTQELARQAGATVVEHTFVDYASQKNWGLDNLPFRSQWICILDADERITWDLRTEIVTRLRANPAIDGFYVNRLPLFMGRPIRHGGMYPSWNLRLLRRGTCRYEIRAVHEHVVCDGPTAYLAGEMLHIRRESLTRYIAKHIRYADMESDEWLKMRSGRSQSAPPLKLFPGALGWRQWFRRNFLPRIPGNPIWRVLYMYILRLGFLDGLAGLRLARLMGCYEYMIAAIYNEKLARRKLKTARCPAVSGKQS